LNNRHQKRGKRGMLIEIKDEGQDKKYWGMQIEISDEGECSSDYFFNFRSGSSMRNKIWR
jgi:hypothetical protein